MATFTLRTPNNWCNINLNPSPLPADRRVPSLLWYTSGYSKSYTKPPPTAGELRASKLHKTGPSQYGWSLRAVLFGRSKARKATRPAAVLTGKPLEEEKDEKGKEGETSSKGAVSAASKTVLEKESEKSASGRPDAPPDTATRSGSVAASYAGSEVGGHGSAAEKPAEEDEKAEIGGGNEKHDKAIEGAEGAEAEDEAERQQEGEEAEERKSA